ncbi:MAG: hypothetical protein JJT96_15125 [Opitutales bacterium]|nr:hypothetical protein [Opitutales bacterium]
MNSIIRNRLYAAFSRTPEEASPVPEAADGIEEQQLDTDRLLVLSARLRKKERDLENLRIELAEWERLLSAREDYLRTCEANVARPGRLSLEQREAALTRRLREVKERELLVEQQLAQVAFRAASLGSSATSRAAG